MLCGDSMKKKLQILISAAINSLENQGKITVKLAADEICVERARQASHGDFACNVAMIIAKKIGYSPMELAQLILDHLPASDIIKQASVASPGFINFFIQEHALQLVVNTVLSAGKEYGRSNLGNNQRICIEFVSANPNGPLHVGHGRGAAQGATLGNLLEAVGYQVHREYYVNDAGRQMHTLAVSLWLRYLALFEPTICLPEKAYQGDYLISIAQLLREQVGNRLQRDSKQVFDNLPNNKSSNVSSEDDEENNADIYIDALILRTQQLLGNDYPLLFSFGLDWVLKDIKEDLAEFGVHFDSWFPESNLVKNGAIQGGIELLQQRGYTYEKEGALWFRAMDFGDDKDRVLLRKNGQYTYFAGDMAYHLYKYQQGYDHLIDIFGADHHGYVTRIKAFLKATGCDPDKLDILLVQFAILYRGKERVSMSTRGGQFVTVRELRKEVGNDAARFFYVMRKLTQTLDFDLELAKSQSSDNPVYYIQYAHARICSVFRQLSAKQWQWNMDQGLQQLDNLSLEQERSLLLYLMRYPEVVESSASQYEPHLLAYYLQELANVFHAYYNSEQFLVPDENLRQARLCLIGAIRQVIANGLGLLGVSAPETM